MIQTIPDNFIKNKPGCLKSTAFRPFLGLVLGLFCCHGTYAMCPGEADKALNSAIKIAQEWPLRPVNDSVTQYLQQLGERLVAQGKAVAKSLPYYDGMPEQWHFLIVRDLSVNAFSIGNGRIYITDGSLAFADTESELAAMLSHEIGHQLAGHFCRAAASNDFGGLFDVFSPLPPQQHQVGVGSMTLVIDPVKEQQADQIAISILRMGGYDPYALLYLARRLPSAATEHLRDANRIQFLEHAIANVPRLPAESSEEFRAIKRSITAN
ncbi:MAG: M48 family metallopeptidase [Methylococcaceae bacterium]|nr:M48 family metallopeptidase [Methylococcaceae bacterium]